MLSIILFILLCPATAHRIFQYTTTTPNTDVRTFAICTCAKCGSSSVFRALYESIYGEKYHGHKLHKFNAWPEMPDARIDRPTRVSQKVDEVYQINRDPLDRYISSFHSKIKCCPLSTKKCFPDRDRFIGPLLKLARMSNKNNPECLNFDEYTQVLQRIHENGDEALINEHFSPQKPCSDMKKVMYGPPAILENIDASTYALNRPLKMATTHVTKRTGFSPSDESLRRLCDISGDEYRWMNEVSIHGSTIMSCEDSRRKLFGPPTAHKIIQYTTTSTTSASFAICTANKGVETWGVYDAVYRSIYGAPFEASPNSTYVEIVNKWTEPPNGVLNVLERAPEDGSELWQVVIDPLDRYISTFRKYIECDGPAQAPWIVRGLLKLAGTVRARRLTKSAWGALAKGVVRSDSKLLEKSPPKECLNFDEYTKALERVHAKGLASKLPEMLMPQEPCFGRSSNSYIGYPSVLKNINATEFGLQQPINGRYSVVQSELLPDDESLRRLCGISDGEYRWLDSLSTVGTVRSCSLSMLKMFGKYLSSGNVWTPPQMVLKGDSIMKGGWNNSPIVIEKYKLLLFTIPKNGCTVLRQLARRMMGLSDWQTANDNIPHEPRINGLSYLGNFSVEEATIMMTSPEWTRAVFLRDPLTRILSAYLDKGVRTPYVQRTCKVKPESFSDFIDIISWCKDDHWRAQRSFLDEKWWPYITFTGYMATAANDIQKLLKPMNLWEPFGANWIQGSPIFKKNHAKNRATHAKNKIQKYYNDDLIRRVEDMYQEDVAVWMPFYERWTKTMMPRIRAAGAVVRAGFHETHLKNDHSSVTNADLESSRVLTNEWDLTPIISEETWKSRWSLEPQLPNMLTWVDPLDATQEYTEGLTQYVTIMACFTLNGFPKAGIIHFPFRNETWTVMGKEIQTNSEISEYPTETVIVSRSHAGAVKTFTNGYSIEPAGGSGYKSVEVANGDVKAYLHVTKIKTWDICAADALIHAMNGTFVEWTTGSRFHYNTHLHENGLFASKKMGPKWFKLTLTLRSRSFQCACIGIAWLVIYFFPQKKLKAAIEVESKKLSFSLCAAALLTCFVTWGVAQERIMSIDYDGERFQYPAMLIFLSRCVATVVASSLKPPQSTVPFKLFSIASITNIVSSMCQYSALMSTIFPVVVVFKSLKLIPVLIVGCLFFKKKYKPVAYALAVCLAIGVSCTLVSRNGSANKQTFAGLLLMFGYVIADALTSQWQSHVFKKYDTPSLEMMWGVNLCSVIFTGIIVGTSGQFAGAVGFAGRHPEILFHVAALCFPAVIGQWFIFKTIEQHGAAAFAMVMTSRQVFSLLVSCLLFGHVLNGWTVMGIVIVLATLFAKTRVKLAYPSEYKKVPQVDVEKGDLED